MCWYHCGIKAMDCVLAAFRGHSIIMQSQIITLYFQDGYIAEDRVCLTLYPAVIEDRLSHQTEVE